MSDHTYKISYDLSIDQGDHTAVSIKASGRGGCDAFMFFSILYPEDGSYSQMHFSLDGRTGQQLTPNDIWKLWNVLGAQLAQSGIENGLAEWQVAMCQRMLDETRKQFGITVKP